MSKFIPMYDLESLTEEQKQEYVRNVCAHIGVPPELNLVMLTYLDEQDGPRRLVAYAKRGATEIIRNTRGINVTNMTHEKVGDSIVFTVTGKDDKGRQEMSVGSKWIGGLLGRELDDAIMTAQTRATRRMTLQFVGAGILDESEVNPQRVVELKNAMAIPVAPLPVAAPVNLPGKDVTPVAAELKKEDYTVGLVKPSEADMEQFTKEQERIRQEAIDALNKKEPAEKPVEDKPKVKRARKLKTVDLGPSESPKMVAEHYTASDGEPTGRIVMVPAVAPTPAPQQPAPVAIAPTPVAVAPPAPPVINGRVKRTLDEIKTYKQRMFKLTEKLEESGFAPKIGMGNPVKMKNLAILMFPEVIDLNYLTNDEWEKFLSTLERKLASEGAAATISYIEESIGL